MIIREPLHMLHGGIVILAVLCGLLMIGCRDRPRYVGPEGLVLDVASGPAVVRQTVTGMVHCPSCPPDATTMLIELYLPQRVSAEPVVTVGFEHLGAYSITAAVPYGALLDIRATLFTTGGIRTANASTYATDEDDADEASATVDLAVP